MDEPDSVLVLLAQTEDTTRTHTDAGVAYRIDGRQSVVIGTTGDYLGVVLAGRVEVVVVRGKTGFFETASLVGREHAEGGAHYESAEPETDLA